MVVEVLEELATLRFTNGVDHNAWGESHDDLETTRCVTSLPDNTVEARRAVQGQTHWRRGVGQEIGPGADDPIGGRADHSRIVGSTSCSW